MKKIGKILGVVLAFVLVLAMAIPAFAAETWTGDIIIQGTEDVPVTGKTFKAYQILAAVAIDEDDLSKGVAYTVPDSMADFFAAYGENIDEISDTLEAMSAAELQAFAIEALAAAKDAGIVPAESVADGDNAKFSNLPFGYYVIEDKGAATPISALMLRTTSEVVTVKADKPFITKKIDGETDGDVTTSELVDYNTAAIGETVPYVLKSKVPAMEGYTKYEYIVTDTFSAGLTFNDDVAVTIGGVEFTDFTVEENGQVVTITFNNFISLADKAGQDIVITYSATVNENAVIGVEGNPNTVNLTYSNNPQVDTSKETTPDDTVITYVVDLVINKTKENGDALEGATFEVKDGDGNVVASGASDENGVVNLTWTNGVGLKDGVTYTITETVVPDGYNKADDITFTVTCKDPKTGTDCTWEPADGIVAFVRTEGAEADDYFETTIINTTGGLLPETGGIGTTIFYIIGSLLVIGAVIFLISKKKMSVEQ